MAQVDHARRTRWFDTGVAALRHIFNDRSISFYVCPLCLVPYDDNSIEDKTLTDEDVPSRATGGRPMVLTCHGCNNGHGHSLDVHQARLVKFLRFGQRTPGVSLRANLVGPEGFINRGEAVWSEDGQTLQHSGIERINDWRDRETRLEQFKEVMAAGSINLTFVDMPNQRRARMSLYRSAYLVAFAMYGYALTNRETFDSARSAFNSPDDLSWTPPIAHMQDVDVAHRAVFAIDGPDEFADTIGVLLHSHIAVVPWITQPADFYDRLHQRLGNGNLTISPKIGVRLQWPTAPAHSLDFAVDEDARRSWAAPPPE